MYPRVLLADDNLTVQRIVAATLRGGGFDVAVVDDGAAALDSVKTTPPDLILADFNLEGINLFAFAKSARMESGLAGIPIWALVGPTDTYDAAQLQSAGIQSCFKKPIDSIHLLQTIKMHFPKGKEVDVNEPTLLMTSLPMENEGSNLSVSQTFPSERIDILPLLLPAPDAASRQNESALQTDPSAVVVDLPLSVCAVHPTTEPVEICSVPMPSTDEIDKGTPLKDEADREGIPGVAEIVPTSFSTIDEPMRSLLPMILPEGGAALSAGATPPPATDLSPNATGEVPSAASLPVISAESVRQAVAAALPDILRSILTPEMIHAALEKVAREIVPPIAEAEIIKEIKRLEPSAK